MGINFFNSPFENFAPATSTFTRAPSETSSVRSTVFFALSYVPRRTAARPLKWPFLTRNLRIRLVPFCILTLVISLPAFNLNLKQSRCPGIQYCLSDGSRQPEHARL